MLLNILSITSLLQGDSSKCIPSDGSVLFVGVESFIVQKSVGENSGSLIGPRDTKGFRIVDGDWSIPRLRRYICTMRIVKTVNDCYNLIKNFKWYKIYYHQKVILSRYKFQNMHEKLPNDGLI